MSTPTALEVLREFLRWRRAQGQYGGLCQCPHTPEEVGAALAAVLRDAERFKALELAHGNDKLDVRTTDGLLGPRGKWLSYGGTLSELADRLREETK